MLENIFSVYFGIKISLENLHMIFGEFIEHTFQFLVEAVLYIIQYILCEAWTFRIMIWGQKPLIILCYILSLGNSICLTSDKIILCTKTVYLIQTSQSPFHRKVYSPAGSVSPHSHMTCTLAKSIVYFDSYFETH
jgi:hypothetical protein